MTVLHADILAWLSRTSITVTVPPCRPLLTFAPPQKRLNTPHMERHAKFIWGGPNLRPTATTDVLQAIYGLAAAPP